MNFDLDTEEGMANAVQWTQDLLATSQEDTVMWAVPRSGTLVMVRKQAKTAAISYGEPDTSIARVLRAMGYAVREYGLPDTPPLGTVIQ